MYIQNELKLMVYSLYFFSARWPADIQEMSLLFGLCKNKTSRYYRRSGGVSLVMMMMITAGGDLPSVASSSPCCSSVDPITRKRKRMRVYVATVVKIDAHCTGSYT